MPHNLTKIRPHSRLDQLYLQFAHPLNIQPPTRAANTMTPPKDLNINTTLPLPNTSLRIPQLGFGVYQSPANVCEASCLHALRSGYRHIDSAQFYANESQVGTALAQSGLKRKDVFLTTKIMSPSSSAQSTYDKIIKSVEQMHPRQDGQEGESYVDLFLIHSPSSGSSGRKTMWQALERAHGEGRIKAIGVSNFGKGHIEELKSFAKVWPPHVNQIELHPWCQQREIVEYCQRQGIVVEAYCPIVRNQKAKDPTLMGVAKAHQVEGKQVTPNQVLIRYCLQKGWVPLPKSDTPSRIEENADVYGFSLSGEEMKKLDGLDEGARGALVQAVKNG